MKTTRLFITLLVGATILLSGCNNDDDPVTYTVTVTQDANGTAETDKTTAEAGATVKLTATPNDGYIFEKWTVVSGDITLLPDAMTNPATFTMPANAVSVKAEFTEIPKQYSIYLAGYYQNANYDNFAYTLINGVQTDLPAPTGGFDATPLSMTVSGGKTYVSGSYFDSDGWARACYWVDGAVRKLDGLAGRDEDQTDYVHSITVSDNKIYTAGNYAKDYNSVPCYWVDGTLTTLALPAGATFGGAYSIAVSGGKIYVAGYAYQSNKRVPGYWLDGTFVPLGIPDGAVLQINIGMRIAVADKVYVMGTYLLNSVYYPCVWADGNRTELAFDASASKGAYGTSMTVADGKVYVAGYSITDNRNKACYWADGTRTDLDTPADMYSDGRSIGVIDGKVYVSGRYYDSSNAYKPCYWFGGERTDLDIPTGGTQASIMGMYVSE